MDDLEAVIGLEVHAQLSTRSKLFCRCPTAWGAEPNTRVCPVCLGLPGALPVLNPAAVELAVRAGLATACRIRGESRFERKNYFYPDNPKNYQITQYREPLCTRGNVVLPDRKTRFGIARIHLEEDAGKLIHGASGATLVDMNRCGVPLIEIVSEPVIRSAAQARAYVRTLRDLLRYIGVCDGDMEKGNLRCDANTSLRRAGSGRMGVKTEIKNLNSFRFVERALDFEIRRQERVIRSGGAVKPDTLLWDDARGEAISMRTKEAAHDYRYFPEPDLPVVRVPDRLLRDVEQTMPELPDERARRFVERFGLSGHTAGVLVSTREMADYFEAVAEAAGNATAAANWVTGEVRYELNRRGIGLDGLRVTPADLARLVDLVTTGRVNAHTARRVFGEMVETGRTADDIVAAAGLGRIADDATIREAAGRAVADNPDARKKYANGKTNILNFFVGQTMKITGGRADPDRVVAALKRILDAAPPGDDNPR